MFRVFLTHGVDAFYSETSNLRRTLRFTQDPDSARDPHSHRNLNTGPLLKSCPPFKKLHQNEFTAF